MDREDGLETAAKCGGLSDELVKRRGHGERSSPASVEDYAKSNVLEVHIYYRLRRADNHCRHYCIVMKGMLDGTLRVHPNGRRMAWAPLPANLSLLDHRQAFDEKPMFISNVGFVQEAESAITVPAGMVRLHVLQDCSCLGAYKIMDLPFSESCSVAADGESSVPRAGRLDSAVMLDNQRPEEVVDGASDVVDTVSDDQCPFGHGRLAMQLQSKDVHAFVGMHFFPDSVSIRVINERAQRRIECVTVMACSRELGAIGVQKILGDGSSTSRAELSDSRSFVRAVPSRTQQVEFSRLLCRAATLETVNVSRCGGLSGPLPAAARSA